MTILRHALDNAERPVFIGMHLLDKDHNFINSAHFHLRIAKTIEHPTVIIDIVGSCQKRYYFRAINWHRTLLVCVKIGNGLSEVEQYIEDPSGKLMAQLYRNANFASL